ncbi:Elongation of very long chain fatty acids protein 1 [Pseudolycoriella hygida]|uniref:Elongation of very long chain fatty acids protein n=1 Tax=Pseudolycoriella hygida TaxID=35572 RepID=A0A9Q0MZL4_9DIPT|nr:Elongation of very long chain fatty acids protein 1 [Pseudolycoriella hygida]
MSTSEPSLAEALWDPKYTIHDIFDIGSSELTRPYLPGAPTYLATIDLAYLAFIYYIGPKFMKDRKPYDLKGTIRIYNLINIVINSVWFTLAFYYSNFIYDCWMCRKSEIPDYLIISAGLWYMCLKIFDLLDTIFFVLRKKSNQLTFLHVSHHAIMPFTAWFATKYAPVVTTALTPILNSFVHMVMYTYYYKVSKGVELSWIKQYITIMQLVQFVIITAHAAHLMLMPSCDYPKWFASIELAHGLFFIYTFSGFYRNAYSKRNNQSVSVETNDRTTEICTIKQD